jgi:hypothetical protein
VKDTGRRRSIRLLRQNGRQPFAVCFHARPLSGSPGGDQVETSDARWFTIGDIPALPIRPAMRLRIGHPLTPGRSLTRHCPTRPDISPRSACVYRLVVTNMLL